MAEMDKATRTAKQKAWEAYRNSRRITGVLDGPAFYGGFDEGVEHGREEGHNDAFVPGSSFIEKERDALQAKLAKLLAAARQLKGKHLRYCQSASRHGGPGYGPPKRCDCDLGVLAVAVKEADGG